MKISKQQQGQFWRVFAQACTSLGIPGDGRDEYRHRVIREEAGVEHLGDISPTGDFDKVMTRLALDAGDFALAAKYSAGDVSRYRKLILDRAGDIIAGTATTPGEYVAGIVFQGRMVYRPYDTPKTFGAKLDSDDLGVWTDMPVATLRLVLQIVTTEWRKVQARKPRADRD